ncbi:hypothetical protein BGZ51_003313 [Haplosporangium sp. Z 767]|nr:hypothetical protein BGZ51_003313 [Haplosporangium sp. Z 767]
MRPDAIVYCIIDLTPSSSSPSSPSSPSSSSSTITTADLTTDSTQPTAITTTEAPTTTTTITTTAEPITTTTEEPITTTTLEPSITTTTLEPVPTTTTVTVITTTTTTTAAPIITTASTTVAPPVITPPKPTTTQTKTLKPSSDGRPSKDPNDRPTATAPDAHAQPSDTSSSASSGSSSSSNKTGITIGVVIGAIVIAAGIGVWVFRKWKLSPSRQFKSKIRNSTSGGLGATGVGGDKASDYDAYNDIFHPAPHDNARPVAASSMGGTASGSGTSPQMQYRQQQEEYDLQSQGQQLPMSEPLHSHHMNMENAATVPNYSQYRYAQAGQGPMMTGVNGYDTGVSETILGAGNNGAYYQQQHPMYTPQEYGTYDDNFLRELRE